MGTGAEIALISIAATGLAASVGMGVQQGLAQKEMAEQQNEAIEKAKVRARSNTSIQLKQNQNNRDLLTKNALRKADYASLQESSARAEARGKAKAALEQGGRLADAGTAGLAQIEQIEMKSSWKQHLISKGAQMQVNDAQNQYQAAQLGVMQQYENTYYNLDNQIGNAFNAGLAGGMSAFSGGVGITGGIMGITGGAIPGGGGDGGDTAIGGGTPGGGTA